MDGEIKQFVQLPLVRQYGKHACRELHEYDSCTSKEDGLYRFYRDGELILTPTGVIVETPNKESCGKNLV